MMLIRHDLELTKLRVAHDNSIDLFRIVEKRLKSEHVCESYCTCWLAMQLDEQLPALALYVPQWLCEKFMIMQVVYRPLLFLVEILCIDKMPRAFLGYVLFKAPKTA